MGGFLPFGGGVDPYGRGGYGELGPPNRPQPRGGQIGIPERGMGGQLDPEVAQAMERMRGMRGYDQAQAMQRGPSFGPELMRQNMSWQQGRPQAPQGGFMPRMSPMLQRGAQAGGWARPEGMMGGRIEGMQPALRGLGMGRGLQAPPSPMGRRMGPF